MMKTVDLHELTHATRNILLAPVEPDAFLTDIATEHPSHRFLGNCTQAVYRRQVQFLSAILVHQFHKPKSAISVHDWGCGKGHITHMLKAEGFLVSASDFQDSSADSAFGQETPIIDRLGIDVVPLLDPVRLPFQDASFDAVTSFGVLEHVPQDLNSLREIRRVLGTGGIFFLTFLPYTLSWTQALSRLRGNAYHDRLYWRHRVHELAKIAGFSVQCMWLGQLFPKNSVPIKYDRILEPIDRYACWHTPLGYFATNIEAVLVAN